MYPRLLNPPTQSFFLFGARGVGKTTWAQSVIPEAKRLSLLDQRLYLRLLRDPHAIAEILGGLKPHSWVFLDEVQKIPSLLDEVHRLIEEKKLKFILTGSSARKLKRGGANLLGGRALTLRMESLSSAELKEAFVLNDCLQWGGLPLVAQESSNRAEILDSYVSTYLKEEIKEEGLVRKLEPFVRFLEVAGIVNAEILNLENIARDAAVPRSSLDGYFGILEETLLGTRLYPYQPGMKVREVKHPKFYWLDPGVARGAAGLLHEPVDAAWLGKAFETWIFHEIRVHSETARKFRPIYYFRTGAGVEIDFIIETRRKTLSQSSEVIALEVKYSKKWDRRWSKGVADFAAHGKVKVRDQIGVYLGSDELKVGSMRVLPVGQFLAELHEGRIF